MSILRWAILLLAMGTITGCDDGGPPVRIVIPRDFRGEIQIIETPDAGPLPMKNGELVCEIPKSGKLLVKSFRPFQQGHVETYFYSDGSRAMKYERLSDAVSDEIGIFGGFTSGYPQPILHFFVGNRIDARKWWK